MLARRNLVDNITFDKVRKLINISLTILMTTRVVAVLLFTISEHSVRDNLLLIAFVSRISVELI